MSTWPTNMAFFKQQPTPSGLFTPHARPHAPAERASLPSTRLPLPRLESRWRHQRETPERMMVACPPLRSGPSETECWTLQGLGRCWPVLPPWPTLCTVACEQQTQQSGSPWCMDAPTHTAHALLCATAAIGLAHDCCRPPTSSSQKHRSYVRKVAPKPTVAPANVTLGSLLVSLKGTCPLSVPGP